MSQAFISMPTLQDLSSVTGASKVATPSAALTIDQILIRVDPAPGSGELIKFRIGTDLDGVNETDYANVTITGSASSTDRSVSLAVAAGQNILWKVNEISAGSVAADFSGILRTQQTSTLFSDAGLYTSLESCKLGLGLEGSTLTTEQDDELTRIIQGVSSLFDSITGGTFTQRDLIEYHDGFSLRNGIPLHQHPSSLQGDRTAATVTENGVILTEGVEWMMDRASGSGRSIWRLNGLADSFQGARFATGERNVKVEYKAGPFEVPPDVQLAATQESIRFFQNAHITQSGDGLRIGLTSRTPETGASQSFSPDDLTPATLRMLEAHRRNRWNE